MNPNDQLATVEPRPLAVTEPTTGELLAAVITQGITPSSVEVMERLCALREREEARKAEREYASDMVALQCELPVILANASVPNDDGTTRYKFAQIDHIANILRPIALKYGFTYSFGESGADPSRVTKTCTVMHRGGHSPQPTAFTVRIGKGPPKSSEAQGDGAAATYAQRRALCDAFGIIVDKDSDAADAQIVGAFITPAKADELRARLTACGADIPRFLEWANDGNTDGTFYTIGEARLSEIEMNIRAKEKAKQPPATDLADKDLFH